MPNRRTSRVIKWLDLRSFGFLANPDDEGKPLFVHANQVPNRLGIGKRLMFGEQVEFELGRNAKGVCAVKITFPVQGHQSLACPQRAKPPKTMGQGGAL